MLSSALYSNDNFNNIHHIRKTRCSTASMLRVPSVFTPQKLHQKNRPVFPNCFINTASLYHSPPAKQRAVLKDSKGGIAHHGRFPPLPMKKPRNACVSKAMTKLKNPLCCYGNIIPPSRVIIRCDYVDEIIYVFFTFTLGVVSRNK